MITGISNLGETALGSAGFTHWSVELVAVKKSSIQRLVLCQGAWQEWLVVFAWRWRQHETYLQLELGSPVDSGEYRLS